MANKDQKKKEKGADIKNNVPLLGLRPPGGRLRPRGRLLLRPHRSGALQHPQRHRGVPLRPPRLFGRPPHRRHHRGRHEPPQPRRGVHQDGSSPASVRLRGKRKAGLDEPGPNECTAASGDVHVADIWVLKTKWWRSRRVRFATNISHTLVCLVIHLFPLSYKLQQA